MNPLTGTWIANIEKSQRHANHQFKSATIASMAPARRSRR